MHLFYQEFNILYSILSYNTRQIFAMVKKTCVKCGDHGVVVLNRKDAYCRPCFLHYVSHRFRSTLGKRKIFKSTQKVLVASSGGTCSSALLDLIWDATNPIDDKKLKVEPSVLHLLENPSLFDSGAEYLKKFTTFSKFSVFFAKLSSVLFDENYEIFEGQDFLSQISTSVSAKNDSKLDQLLESMKSETARLDLYKRLKLLALTKCAQELNFQFLMTGECCTRLSADCMSSIALGRGDQLINEICIIDKRFAQSHRVTLVRPLREIEIKALALYNRFKDVQTYPHDHRLLMATKFRPTPASIQRETDQFVLSLCSQFPATVCTLFATASKLSASAGAVYSASAPNNNGNTRSTNYSDSASNNGIADGGNSAPAPNNGGAVDAYSASAPNNKEILFGSDAESSEKICILCMSPVQNVNFACLDELHDFAKNFRSEKLCYGCKSTLRELSDVNLLPGFIRKGLIVE